MCNLKIFRRMLGGYWFQPSFFWWTDGWKRVDLRAYEAAVRLGLPAEAYKDNRSAAFFGWLGLKRVNK